MPTEARDRLPGARGTGCHGVVLGTELGSSRKAASALNH